MLPIEILTGCPRSMEAVGYAVRQMHTCDRSLLYIGCVEHQGVRFPGIAVCHQRDDIAIVFLRVSIGAKLGCKHRFTAKHPSTIVPLCPLASVIVVFH